MYLRLICVTMTNNADKKRRIILKKKYIISLLLVLVLVVASACGSKDDDTPKAKENDNAEGEMEMEMPEPDLTDIPDVVAEVNGKEITGEDFEQTYTGEFQQAAFQAQMSGQEIDEDALKQQIIEGLIGQELLIQAADAEKLEATDEAIDEALANYAAQSQMESVEEFIAALKENGLEEDEVKEQAATQVKIELLIDNNLGEVDTSDEVLQEIYDDVKKQQEEAGAEDFPSFEDSKEDIVEYVKNQKQAETIQTLVDKYREEADVTIHL